jgi:hypothetical protein
MNEVDEIGRSALYHAAQMIVSSCTKISYIDIKKVLLRWLKSLLD